VTASPETPTRRVLGPFGRVEGDLEVRLDIAAGRVRSAQVVSPLYRGFEQILRGKAPADALVLTPRICGICSVSQSVAAARALADLQGLAPAPNGELATNLALAGENLADHLTHFYLFFMPDFAHAAYQPRPWHPEVAQRFQPIRGQVLREILGARAQFLHLLGLLAGHWPHSLALQPGGTTRPLAAQERPRLHAILHGFRRFLETTLFGDALEAVAGLDSIAALRDWAGQGVRPGMNRQADFVRFLRLADDLGLHRLGRGPGRFLSYGAYPLDGRPWFPQGVWDQGLHPLDEGAIREDLSHAWMAQGSGAKHPFEGITQPDPEAAAGYTWCKAPRLDGRPLEVGALARQQVAGHPLIRALVRESGANVRNRVIARLLELALVVPLMEDWVRQLRPGEPFLTLAATPPEGQGRGLVEAARGSLGHWLRVRNGCILSYQILAPTTWNFSPRDAAGIPGPLEQALEGTPCDPAQETPPEVQHVVRSFDPCMACTVH
jgi:uptake hydrogenase large subunit